MPIKNAYKKDGRGKMMNDIQGAQVVGHIPSGLFIVCGKNEQHIDGYLASWIQQISFNPLLITLAVKPGRPAYEIITAGGVFTINIVGNHNRDYLKHFWSGYSAEKNPFTEIPHFISQQGGVVIKAAKSFIDCRIKEKISPGDHQLLIATVIAGEVLNEKAAPVTHIRKTGLSY